MDPVPVERLTDENQQMSDETYSLSDNLEVFLGTLAGLFAAEGMAREVAVLTLAQPRIQYVEVDNWDGGTDVWKIILGIEIGLFTQLGDERKAIEDALSDKAGLALRIFERTWVKEFVLVPEITDDPHWREKSQAWLTGKGMTNQGRVRSDNVAGLTCDGLLFRSQPEIWLYQALKSLGVSFAPLPVFVRGGEAYRRIEPDFVVFKGGVLMIVEVDGDTVHRESPVEAHARTTMLVHEGAHVERVRADECADAQKARACATRLIGILEKIRANR